MSERAVRVISCEIVRLDEQASEQWLELAYILRQAANRWWQEWLAYHLAAGHVDAMQRYWLEYRRWAKSKDGKPKPQAPKVSPMPDGLPKKLYDVITQAFPEVHAMTRCMFLKRSAQSLTKQSAGVPLPVWKAVLSGLESVPSFHHPMPIPLYPANRNVNFRLFPPADGSRNWRAEISVLREGSKQMKPVPVELLTGTEKTWRLRTVLAKVYSREWEPKGSMLVYSKSKRKWFLKVGYVPPKEQPRALRADVVCHFSAGRYMPWRVAFYGPGVAPCGKDDRRWFPYGGRGVHLAGARERIRRRRREIQEAYRWSSSGRKGHGRRRCLAPLRNLSDAWRAVAKSYIDLTTTRLVRRAIAFGAGTLVYHQPAGRYAARRFLAWCGTEFDDAPVHDGADRPRDASKKDGKPAETAWPWYMVKAILAYKCNHAGIKFVDATAGENKKRKRTRKSKGASHGSESRRRKGKASRGRQPGRAAQELAG